MIIRGRTWILGDNIDTDLIVPGQYLASSIEDAAPHALEAIEPLFASQVKKGDIIVAGKNFGCGSSRESAPQVLKHLGIGCILAENFARIFFRNAIAIGLPALVIQNIAEVLTPQEEVLVSLESGSIVRISTGEEFRATPMPDKMREIISVGGIDGMLKIIGAQTKP